MSCEKLVVNGIEYVRADTIPAAQQPKSPRVLVRCDRSGVFFGELIDGPNGIRGQSGIMKNVRWLWSWSGAASLFQLALDGPGNPAGCKFPATMSKIQLTDIIEVIEVTETAAIKMDEVPVWKK